MSKYIKQIDTIMSREVSRAEFIKYVGLALIAMLGITTFLKNLSRNLSKDSHKQSSGYGSSPYGL